MLSLLDQPRFRLWLLTAGVSILTIGSAYTLVQQSTRLAADDLPLASAQTIQHELTSGAAPKDVVPAVKTDLSSDSTVFATITDNSQHILASSALLNGQTPLPPPGVFSYTKAHNSDHFTWQPTNGVRLATRVLAYGGDSDGGFIITGQSLVQAENRINDYGLIALASLIGITAWTTLMLYWPNRQAAKAKK